MTKTRTKRKSIRFQSLCFYFRVYQKLPCLIFRSIELYVAVDIKRRIYIYIFLYENLEFRLVKLSKMNERNIRSAIDY